ncbi:MAG: TadE/TadG family type IV pilus assembly protein [Actinomycetota bacterium]
MRFDERGQSTVEFALILPLIMLLLLCLLQAGTMFRDQLLVSAAAREAAREASVTTDTSRVQAAADRSAPGLDLSIRLERGPKRGDVARVEVSARPVALPLVGAIVSNRRVSSTASMRVETSRVETSK